MRLGVTCGIQRASRLGIRPQASSKICLQSPWAVHPGTAVNLHPRYQSIVKLDCIQAGLLHAATSFSDAALHETEPQPHLRDPDPLPSCRQGQEYAGHLCLNQKEAASWLGRPAGCLSGFWASPDLAPRMSMARVPESTSVLCDIPGKVRS